MNRFISIDELLFFINKRSGVRVSDRFIIVLVSLIFSFVLKGNAFSNYFVRLALDNDHKLMKTSLNQTLRPFFSALSSNTFPGASHDNIGGG